MLTRNRTVSVGKGCSRNMGDCTAYAQHTLHECLEPSPFFRRGRNIFNLVFRDTQCIPAV